MDNAMARRNSYVAYMLRLWQVGSRDGIPVWRASLENPHTGERLAFGQMEDLLTFLADLLAGLTAGTAPSENADTGSSDHGP